MIFDKQSLFSDSQAITDTAASTNVIDLGAAGTPIGGVAPLKRDLGAGGPVKMRIQVTETFATLTSLKASIQVSDAEDFGSGVVTVAESEAIAAADLVEGYVFNPGFVPEKVDKRYVRMYFTVAGTTATAGKVIAGLVTGSPTNV